MVPTITTARLRLRPFVADDAEALVRILSVEDVYRQLGGQDHLAVPLLPD